MATVASLTPIAGQQSCSLVQKKLIHQYFPRAFGCRRTLVPTQDLCRLRCYKREAVTVYEGEEDTWEDPNEKPDFWEGERWDLMGQIISKLYIFAIVVAVGAAGYAASTYSGTSELEAKEYAIEMAQSSLEEAEDAALAEGAALAEDTALPAEE